MLASNDLMENPIWMLVPWAVFAVALAIKAWRFAAVLRRHLIARPVTTDQARQSLERIWQRGQQAS
jgi:hypothetical protein